MAAFTSLPSCTDPDPPAAFDAASFQEVFDLAPSFMAVVRGSEHVFERVNPAYVEHVGRRPLLGRRVCDALPEVVAQGFVAILDGVYASGRPFVASEMEILLERNGHGVEQRFVSFVYQPLRDAAGVVNGIVAHGVDVTGHVAARRELAEREARFRSLIENSHDKITVLSPDGMIRYESPAVEALLGWNAEQLTGTNILDLVHPADQVLVRRRMMSALRRPGEPTRFELRMKHCDGSWRTFEAVGHAHDTPGGLELVSNCRDITERRAAEQELRASEERFRALVELLPQLVWSTTADGYHDYYNQRWYDYTGMSRTGDQGWNWKDFLHPDDYERTLETWHESLATGRPYEVEYRFRRARDGAYRWFMGRALPLRDAEGCIVRWFGTCTDVHDERMALEAAHVMGARFTAVARATSDIVWDRDLATGELWCNENAQRTLRLPNSRPCATVADWENRIHEEDRAAVLSTQRAALADGSDVWTAEYRMRCGDGGIAHILDRGLVIRAADGRPVRMIGSMVDLTARMQLEAELRQAQKLDAIGRLAGGVAHDFNNLLTVITSYTEIMFTDLPSSDPLRADVDEIRKAANRAAALTRQLLAFSRRQMLQPRTIDLNEIVTDVGRMLRRLIGENIELVTRPGSALRVIRADPGQIEQIIMNLAVNARDAMAEGGTLEITTANTHVDEWMATRAGITPGDYVELVVQDSGTGMSPAVLARVFEPFFTTKPAGRGTGLGLATVHGIVRQSGGSIEIESTPGAGTRVCIRLPATDEPLSALGPAPAADVSTGHGTILLVEDEDAVRGITRRSLKRAGYTVLEARDGTEALAIAKDGAGIDLVITDLVMPGISGRDLAARLRECHCAPPVLFMSGYAEEDVLPSGELETGSRLLEKPFTVGQLLAAVSASLAAGA
jgi:PAS domain S-box-containing protein